MKIDYTYRVNLIYTMTNSLSQTAQQASSLIASVWLFKQLAIEHIQLIVSAKFKQIRKRIFHSCFSSLGTVLRLDHSRGDHRFDKTPNKATGN